MSSLLILLCTGIFIHRRFFSYTRKNSFNAHFCFFKTDKYWNNLPFYKTQLFKSFTEHHGNTFSIFRPIEAIELKLCSRFGNNVRSTINGLAVADSLNISIIYYNPHVLWWINDKISDTRFIFIPGEPHDDINILKHDFFFDFPEYRTNKSQFHGYFAPHFRSILPKIKFPNNTLIIHVRSGDVYLSKNVHELYAQPPLCFYQKIIKEKWNKIILLCEDKRNPVVPALIKYGIEYHAFDLRTTIQYLFYADNLVTGIGTFADGVLQCCDIPKLIYRYAELFQKDFWNIGGYYNKTYRIFVNPRSNIYHQKMYPWKGTKDQIIIQSTSQCDDRFILISYGKTPG